MENKKSFILYSDIINIVEKLSDEIAGKLFKLILDYVNDKNPKTDDLLLQIAFEPIKQALKRDLIKWKNTSAIRSSMGKLGGIKSGKKREEMKQNEANEAIASKLKQNEANEAIASKLKQNEAKGSKRKQNEHDNVNDSVNDSVNGKEKKDIDIINNNNNYSWIKNFEIYRKNTTKAFQALENDKEYIAKLQTFYPNYNIITSIRKSYSGYWGKETGWRKKIKAAKEAIREHGSYVIDWKTTLINNLEISRVFYTKDELNKMQ